MRGSRAAGAEKAVRRGVERHAGAGLDRGNVHHRHAGTGARLERIRKREPLARGDDAQVRRGLGLGAERPGVVDGQHRVRGRAGLQRDGRRDAGPDGAELLPGRSRVISPPPPRPPHLERSASPSRRPPPAKALGEQDTTAERGPRATEDQGTRQQGRPPTDTRGHLPGPRARGS